MTEDFTNRQLRQLAAIEAESRVLGGAMRELASPLSEGDPKASSPSESGRGPGWRNVDGDMRYSSAWLSDGEPLRLVGPDVRAEHERVRGLSEEREILNDPETVADLLATGVEPDDHARLYSGIRAELSGPDVLGGPSGDPMASAATPSPIRKDGGSSGPESAAAASLAVRDMAEIREEIGRLLDELRGPLLAYFRDPTNADYARAYTYRGVKHRQLARLYDDLADLMGEETT